MFKNQFLFVLFWSIYFIVDGFDGYYARLVNKTTKMGVYLDHVGDFVLGILMLIKSFLFLGYWWIWLIISLSSISMLVIMRKGIMSTNCSARTYIPFFLFGLYGLGLGFELIVKPVDLVLTLFVRKRSEVKV